MNANIGQRYFFIGRESSLDIAAFKKGSRPARMHQAQVKAPGPCPSKGEDLSARAVLFQW